MKAVISRTYGKFETRGSLFVLDGHELLYRCKTLELPSNGNQRNVSCIPEGVYDVVKIESPKRGTVFFVQDVPGRDSILIHVGNYTTDTQGCIIPGSYFEDLNEDSHIDIAESTKAMKMLLQILPDEFKLHIL